MPSDAGSTTVLWVLRISFAIRCIGLGFKFLWREFESETPIFGLLFFDWHWSENATQRIDDGLVYLMVAAGVAVLCTGWSKGRGARWIEGAMLSFAVFFETTYALAAWQRGGEMLSQWALAEHGLRIAVPAVLILIGIFHANRTGDVLLRLATSATFLAHGLKAWFVAPVFVTMILASYQTLFGSSLQQSYAEQLLKVIGVADILVAVGILVFRWPALALYAAFWGGITAIGRTTANSGHWHETLIRAVHFGGPFAIFLLWRMSKRRSLTAGARAGEDDNGHQTSQ